MIQLTIESGDVTTFECDALVLKYAQAFYGADATVAAFGRKTSVVRFTFFSKRIRAGDLRHSAMHGFESEFALHFINEGKMANRNRLRPAFVSSTDLAAQRFTYPLMACLLKLRNFPKATQSA